MRKYQEIILFVLLSLTCFILTACGIAHSNVQVDEIAETMAAAAPGDAPANSGEYDELFLNSGQNIDSYKVENEADGSGPVGTEPSSVPLSSNRKLIRNVSMNVETDAFDTLLSNLNRKITELGGYVEYSETSGNGITLKNRPVPRYASITARIPSDKLNQFITTVEHNGNVIGKSENTSDVTLQYSDIESRKKSLMLEQDRIWALLEKADSLESVIALEERLSEIRYELESMESQLRLFDNQVDYSTVAIQINEVLSQDLTPTSPVTISQRIQTGFSQTLKAVSTGLTDFFIFLVILSPVWIPILIIIILCSLIVRYKKKRALTYLKKSEQKRTNSIENTANESGTGNKNSHENKDNADKAENTANNENGEKAE